MLVTVENQLDVAVYVTATRLSPRDVQITVSDARRIGIVGETLWQDRVNPQQEARLRGFQEDTHFAAVVAGFGNEDVYSEFYDGLHTAQPFVRLIVRRRGSAKNLS